MLNLPCGGNHLGFPIDTEKKFKRPFYDYSYTIWV